MLLSARNAYSSSQMNSSLFTQEMQNILGSSACSTSVVRKVIAILIGLPDVSARGFIESRGGWVNIAAYMWCAVKDKPDLGRQFFRQGCTSEDILVMFLLHAYIDNNNRTNFGEDVLSKIGDYDASAVARCIIEGVAEEGVVLNHDRLLTILLTSPAPLVAALINSLAANKNNASIKNHILEIGRSKKESIELNARLRLLFGEPANG